MARPKIGNRYVVRWSDKEFRGKLTQIVENESGITYTFVSKDGGSISPDSFTWKKLVKKPSREYANGFNDGLQKLYKFVEAFTTGSEDALIEQFIRDNKK